MYDLCTLLDRYPPGKRSQKEGSEVLEGSFLVEKKHR